MKRLKYKILPHTADLRLEVFGKNLEELFENAASAVAKILQPSSRGPALAEPRRKRGVAAEQHLVEKIKIQSPNINALLVDFLNEILARSQINKKVYKVHKVIKLESNFIEAEIIGMKVDKFDEDIKAVTYHEVQIVKRDPAFAQGFGGQRKGKGKRIWQTKLVLDI